MTKASGRRRARSEKARFIAAAVPFLRAGDSLRAIPPLLEALRIDPDDPQLINDLGVAYLGARRFGDAIAMLRRSLARVPTWGITHFNLGLALQQVGDDDGALASFKKATFFAPDHAKAHGQLADMLWDRGMRTEAATEYQRTATLAAGTTLGYVATAMALNADDRHNAAVDELRRAMELGAADETFHLRLGQVLQEAGRFAEARASFERSIEAAPRQESAYYGLVAAGRFAEADRPWIARLLAQLESKDRLSLAPAVAARNEMVLRFALGKAFDDLGEYAEAMGHFDRANAAGRKLSIFNRRDLDELANRLIERFTSDHFERCAGVGEADETPILIVGMPRSGTTLLERILSSHPGVRGRGELNYWGSVGPRWGAAEAAQLADIAAAIRGDYLRLLRRGAPDILRAIDKMPFNFFWVGLVHVFFPRARFIYTRRNRIDTCLSIYTTPMLATRTIPRALDDIAYYYDVHSRLMAHWRSVIPTDRWLELDYEEVVADPEAAARRVVDFSGLPWDPACLHPEDNPEVVRTASHWQVRQPIYRTSVQRWRNYESWIAALG